MANPFIQTYDALWALAEESDLLTSLVKVGNRIKLNKVRPGSPIKDEVSQADLPELVLVATSGQPNLRSTSSSSMTIRSYDWLVSTGDMSVSNKLLPVEWALFCAMANWPAILGALTWQGKSFIKRANFTGVSTGFSDPERNRGIAGWSSIWSVEVEMHFSTSDMLTANQAGS